MSFITKRERVFNEYELFDLPSRNEGKLKAYASCTDARAWSHFCSDKTEHLVEIIKRNNDTCRPKYVPTDVIVDTIMVAKNAEIARLRRKIEEFEQMLAAYDQLDLDCHQKCEIGKAHAAIKAANKELDELCLDLDISGYTEGIDSEAFETGKLRGDETPSSTPKMNEISYEFESGFQKMDSVAVQNDLCVCDASTSVEDPRIEDMQDVIIAKDAKLGAMKNTIAVMENDVCEPYCLYAHIYTALEKIFGVLCQNEKYKHYLNMLTTGKDTRCIDIKGKILYKMKVLEKFCVALIAPCSQDFATFPAPQDCTCYRAKVTSRVETTFALTSAESKHPKPSLDNKRAQLVADIIENEEMKEILSKESSFIKPDDELEEYGLAIENYSIDAENLKRLKNLQENYDDLMNCYESLKHEKDCLEIRCRKYEEMEKDFESLKNHMREYNSLWNEKEHYRKRSADLDALKEQYLILTDETLNLETQLKAETEICHIKCKAIDGLRKENTMLEKKINEFSIAFEKEKNALLCQLSEADCKVMCQGQQIKSLSLQIDKLLEQDCEKGQTHDVETHSLELIDEVESLREQIKNLKDAMFCNEEEKQQLHNDFQDKLKLINQLRMEMEDWKSTYEKTLHRNDYLEKYTESFEDEVHRLIDENRHLSQDIEEKTTAVDNLINIINNKSQEVSKLMDEINKKTHENKELFSRLHDLQKSYDSGIIIMENEKKEAFKSLQLARQESHELLEKVKDYDDIVHKEQDVSKSLESQVEDNKGLKDLLRNMVEENKTLKDNVVSRENNNSILLQEIQRLREINTYAVDNISSLQDEKIQFKISSELNKKESGILKERLSDFENLKQQFLNLQVSHERLIEEKQKLENDLLKKSCELDNAIHSIQLTKRESAEVIGKLQQSESFTIDTMTKLSEDYKHLNIEKYALQKDLIDNKRNVETLLQSLNNLKIKNDQLLQKCKQVDDFEQQFKDLKKAYDELVMEKTTLQADFDNKTEEINHLYNTLENKIEENRGLSKDIKSLEMRELTANNNIKSLQNEQLTTQATLNVIKREGADLNDKIKHYESLEVEFDKLKSSHDQLKAEKEKLQNELDNQVADLKKIEQENHDLQSQSQILLTHSKDIENVLINTRTELIKKSSLPDESYKDIMKEIEEMKKEKLSNNHKIRTLLDKLDESDNIISDLSEDVLARDDRIAILENHINELEDEVRTLHRNLAVVVDAGEQIKDHSYQKIDNSLKSMEAHHSKAAHNMKMEIAKLQHTHTRLEQQLSTTQIKSEETSRDKQKYLSQIIHLQNEREIIVTDIKQLEMNSVGDSALSPDNCGVEDILTSIDRVRKYFDARHSKSASLEQTLLKVQTSSQLLLSKADEAKKLVEREKQKIINEKEEAVRDRLYIEKQLLDLNEKLEQQSSNDKCIIKDLEAEILNQKLIIDKINKSTQDYIAKLKEEMQSLRDLYQNSMKKISELQEKDKIATEEKIAYTDSLKKTSAVLEEKSKEIGQLQKQLEQMKKKPHRNVTTQAPFIDMFRNTGTETDKELFYDRKTNHLKPGIIEFENEKKKEQKTENMNMLQVNKPSLDKRSAESKMKQNRDNLNEVQILTANFEPTFDYVRSSYLSYKFKRLGPGKLEQCSISSTSDNDSNRDSHDLSGLSANLSQTPETSKIKQKHPNYKSQKLNLIDIYNKHSRHTNSSKDNDETVTSLKQAPHNEFLGKGSKDSNAKNKYKTSSLFDESSDKSTDKDLFVIYKDSESDNTGKNYESKGPWPANGHSEIIVEALTVHSTEIARTSNLEMKDHTKSALYKEPSVSFDDEEDDSVKPKLNINLPRVEIETSSLVTTSDGDKKSLDSYTVGIYSTPKQISTSDIKISDDMDSTILKQGTTPSLPTTSNEDNPNVDSLSPVIVSGEEATSNDYVKKGIKANTSATRNFHRLPKNTRRNPEQKFDNELQADYDESHHKLTRVGAGVSLLKTERDTKLKEAKDIKKKPDFGLKYIMDTVQGEVDPDNLKYYVNKEIRVTRSDGEFNEMEVRDKRNTSPFRLSALKTSPAVYKTISTLSKDCDNSQAKSYIDQNVMVKLDTKEEYENKINTLTKTLENIEKDYKKKIDAIKIQYDSNIKSIINEHNHGVQSIQSLHEETLQDIIKIHENEVENLRSMSIDAMRKADKLEKENRVLKTKTRGCSSTYLDEEPMKIATTETTKRKKCRGDTKMLTKTTIEAFNVKPKVRSLGPCTCSLDVNLSDTIRNIFEQVDVEQRKMAEYTYMKYIANKIINDNIENLDAQELSFLHLKVCRIWKTKLTKEEALQKKIDSLESELMNKQRHAQQHIAELDRKVAEERRRLQEVREAVCRSNTVTDSQVYSPDSEEHLINSPLPTTAAEKDYVLSVHCGCNTINCNHNVGKRRSAGDIVPALTNGGTRRRPRTETSRAVLAKLDVEERREKKLYNDEPPTRLRRSNERQPPRTYKK